MKKKIEMFANINLQNQQQCKKQRVFVCCFFRSHRLPFMWRVRRSPKNKNGQKQMWHNLCMHQMRWYSFLVHWRCSFLDARFASTIHSHSFFHRAHYQLYIHKKNAIKTELNQIERRTIALEQRPIKKWR